MEVKNKSMVEATYDVVAESGNCVIGAKLTVDGDNVVNKIVAGTVKDGDVLVARFSMWEDGRLQVTYFVGTKEERDAINATIEDFKTSAVTA